MTPGRPKRFWRRARLTFRWFRITIWLGILALICAFLWLNRVGVPGAIQDRVLGRLRAAGLEVSCQRVRLRWYLGLVADQVTLTQPEARARLQITARQLAIRPDYRALFRGALEVRGLSLEDADLRLPLAASNAPLRILNVRRLRAQADFASADRWQLSALQGECLGIEFHLSAALTNAPALFAPKPGAPPPSAPQTEFWNRVLARLEAFRFPGGARLRGSFSSDGARMETTSGRLELSAPRFESPWGSGDLLESTLVFGPVSNLAVRAALTATAHSLESPWARSRSIRMAARSAIPFKEPQFRDASLDAIIEAPETRWGRAARVTANFSSESIPARLQAANCRLQAEVRSLQTPQGTASRLGIDCALERSETPGAPARGACTVVSEGLTTPWLEAPAATLSGQGALTSSNLWPTRLTAQATLGPASWRAVAQAGTPPSAGKPAPPLPPVRALETRLKAAFTPPSREQLDNGPGGWSWTNLAARTRVEAEAVMQDIAFRELTLQRVTLQGRWDAPRAILDSVTAESFSNRLAASGVFNSSSRLLTADLEAVLDPQEVAPMFTTNAAAWRTMARWDQPVSATLQGSVLLPARTDRAPDRLPASLEELRLAGRLRAGKGVIQSVPVESLSAVVSLTNRFLRIRDLELTRPEGALRGEFDLDGGAERFRASLSSSIDPQCLRPALAREEARAAFGYFSFAEPPRIECQVAGRWNDWGACGLSGRAVLSNLTFRGLAIRGVSTGVSYTNRVLTFHRPRIEQPEGTASAEEVRVDFREESVRLSQAESTIDPALLTNSIGGPIVQSLAPYRFERPPRVRFDGRVGIHSKSGLDDARFEVVGDAFQWQQFRLSRVAASLRWLGDTLTLTNFNGVLKEGQVQGDGWFDFSQSAATEFRFQVLATNVNAKPLVADLFPHYTNNLEGLLSGRLAITRATTASDRSWFGHGEVTLRDGLLWDVPVMRGLSPALNLVVPGIGNHRARDATASFFITNSVIVSRDAEIRASGMRLLFDGTVDFEGRLQARVEAQLLRDTPALGWVLSRVFLPFTKVLVYSVTGAIGSPKLEPLYIPKMLMVPFHPLRTLKELFSEPKPEPDPAPNKPPSTP